MQYLSVKPDVFPCLPLSLSLSLTNTHTHPHTHSLTHKCMLCLCFCEYLDSSSSQTLSLSLSLSAAVPLQAGSRFHQEKNLANQRPQLIPLPLQALFLSVSIHLFVLLWLSLPRTVYRCNYTHVVIEHLCTFTVFALDHSHALNPKQRRFKQPGDRLRDTIQKHTIQIMMLKGSQLMLLYLIKCGAQTYRCKMFDEGSRSAVVHYLSVRSGNNMGDAGTGGLCYITD